MMAAEPPSFAPYLDRGRGPAHPISAANLFENRSCRSALGLAECGGERLGKSFLFLRAEETCDRQLAAARNQKQTFDPELRMHVTMQPHPERVERPFAHAPVMAHFAHSQLG